MSGTGETVFAGGGEMRERCRAMNSAETPLGPADEWPEALRTVVRTALESSFAINLWCGPDLVLIYNDAYRHVLGRKHPDALGRPGSDVWAEIWPQIGPMFEAIRAGGPPAYAENAQFVTRRAGEPADAEDSWFTFALSAVRDETGSVVAFLNIVAETTGQVLAERRLVAARRRCGRRGSTGLVPRRPSFDYLPPWKSASTPSPRRRSMRVPVRRRPRLGSGSAI